MTYQVLARKYRPERFQDVIGQDHVTQTLLNAFSQDRIAHAYLFAGPRGIGKTTTARILAKALNCLKNNDGNPCNECQNCTEIADSRSMDVLEIDGASNRGIDEIRNLREVVKYPPINASFKIFIIDEVHMLTTQAFNALLKTLEEPPPHVKFIFATTEPNKVLPTILSRCQRHDFHRLSVNDILMGMSIALQKEKIDIDDKTRQVIARMADGSMRDALSLLDQVIAFCGYKVRFEQALTLLGIIPTSLYFDVTDTIRKRDRKGLLSLMQDVYSEGFALSDFVSGLNTHLLNLLISTVDSEGELLELTSDLRQRYADESQQWDPKDLLRYSDLVTEMENKLKIVQQPRIYVETTMLKLLEMDASVSIEDLISRLSTPSFPAAGRKAEVEKVEQSTLFANPKTEAISVQVSNVKDSGKGKASSSKKPVGEEVSAVGEAGTDPADRLFETIKTEWDDIVAKVSANGTSISTFLSHGTPTSLKGKKLTISIPRKYKFQIDMLKKKALKIESTLEKELGKTIKLNFVTGQDEPESKSPRLRKRNPVTQRMMELFGGEVVK